MTHKPRRFIDGNYFHIFQRGNHKDVVFRENPDRIQFLSKLEEYCDRDDHTIIAYCLMDNHYHLLLRQNGERSITTSLRSLLQGYARYYNFKYGTAGALFQGRFGAKLIDHPMYNPRHLARVSRYIHRNPLPFADFTKYRWSSYQQFTIGAPGACDVSPVMEMFEEKSSYIMFCHDYTPSEHPTKPKNYRVIAGRRLPNDWRTEAEA